MTLLLICILLVLVVVLIGIYIRLSPLQVFSDEIMARQGMQAGRAETVGTEGEELLKRLRSQIKELSETIHLERSTANHREDLLKAERVASQALCAQYHATFLALEVLCVELNAERVDYMEILHRSFGRARVEQIRARRARSDQESAQGENPRARREEETKPDGFRTTPRDQLAAHAQQERALSEEPAALAGEEQPGRARAPTALTMLEGIEEHRKVLTATGSDQGDAEDTTATRVFDKVATAAALGARGGGATRNPQSVPRAVHSGSVAPPASAPPPLPPEPGIMAASLGTRPQGPHGARPPASLQRTATITGMAVLGPPASTESTLSDRSPGPTPKRDRTYRNTHTPAGSPSRAPGSGFAKTLASITAQVAVPTSSPPASSASFSVDETDDEREGNRDTDARMVPPPAPKPGDADGDATEVMAVDQQALQRALSQPAHEELHGVDGVPEAAPGRHLGSSLETPRTSRLPGHKTSE